MSDTTRAWGLTLWAAVVLALIVANVVRPGPGMTDIWPWAGGLLAFPVAAYVVLLRAPRNVIGWLLGFVATCAGVDFGLTWLALTFSGERWAAYAEAFTTPPSVGIFAGILAILHLFPSGEPIGPRHRLVLRVMWGWMGLAALLGLVAPGPVGFSGQANPMGIAPAWVASLFDTAFMGVPVFAIAGVVVLVRRRRRANPVERAQLQWFFAGAAAFAPVMLIVVFWPESKNPYVELSVKLGAMLAFWSVPAAIVVAIVRYHLYDIDRIVSRTVTYVVVAGVLAAVYAASVVALQSVLPQGASQVSVAASTLAVAALFAPLRTAVQHRLDRRFNRARYEQGAVRHRFSRRLQQEIDLETIETDLLAVVGATLQPGEAQLWLSPGSSSIARAHGR